MTHIAFGAAIVAVVGWAAVNLIRPLAKWFWKAVMTSFAVVVSEVVAPDLLRLGNRLSSSIDDMKQANSSDHEKTSQRLTGVESRLVEVESRLGAVEGLLQDPDNQQ